MKTMDNSCKGVIDEILVNESLASVSGQQDSEEILEILSKAREKNGLSLLEIAKLLTVEDPELLNELFISARQVKSEIYGQRVVLFAPLYSSNHCHNECLYCAFRVSNTELSRRALNQEEIAQETMNIVEQGHKRILLVLGEAPGRYGLDYLTESIQTIYKTRSEKGEIRRVNVNVAPLSEDEFRILKATGIGTYQLFQETYHRSTYEKVHVGGQKRDFNWRVSAPDRAMRAGIDDIGIGVLLGLADWRFDLIAMMTHIRHLESIFGVGPHTISVPRIEPAAGSEMAAHPPNPVSDADFLKIIAVLRLAVPYTGMIMSTRETPEMRRLTFSLGISQISAGSRTNPGGYSEGLRNEDAQFEVGDHRSLDEVVRDLVELGYIPSFCTACYRLGRTGQDFMELAKPGDIKYCCEPNALSTFLEYLLDFASPMTAAAGETLIRDRLRLMDAKARASASLMLDSVRSGRRDVYV